MLQYTKATLKAYLQAWIEGNGDQADPEFTAELDLIIQSGELRLLRDLDLSVFNTLDTAAVSSGNPVVPKPADLVRETLVTYAENEASPPNVGTLIKRSRAFVLALNRGDGGTPKFYAEQDEENWVLAPVPSADFTLSVDGQYRYTSIVDGADDGTTWLSTRYPDLLAIACAISAAEKLKNYGRKADAEATYTALLDNTTADSSNQRRPNAETIRLPAMPPDPSTTT